MADDDDYQILPQRDFFQLKKKVDELSGEASPKKLMETMEELKKILNELIELFKATSQEIKQEEKDDVAISKKLDKLMSQNKVIAEAILAVSERIGMHQEAPKESGENAASPLQPQKPSMMPQPPPTQSPMQPMQQPLQPPMQSQPPQMPMQYSQQPFGMQPEPFTPRPFGGFGSPDVKQPFGMQQRQAPFEPPEFAPTTGQSMNIPPSSPFSTATGPQPDFPDMADLTGEKAKKKKGFFGFGK
jgi:hypothetical protein